MKTSYPFTMPSENDGWSAITLLSTPYEKLAFDNLYRYMKRPVGSGVFKLRLVNGVLRTDSTVKIANTFKERRRKIRSAVIEFANGSAVIVSVGETGCEMNLSRSSLYNYDDVCIDMISFSLSA